MFNDLSNIYANRCMLYDLCERSGLSKIDIDNLWSRVYVTRCDREKFRWQHSLNKNELEVLHHKISTFTSVDFIGIISQIHKTNVLLYDLMVQAKMINDINYVSMIRMSSRLNDDMLLFDSQDDSQSWCIKTFLEIILYYKLADIIVMQAIRYMASMKNPYLLGIDILFRKLISGRNDKDIDGVYALMWNYIATSSKANTIISIMKNTPPMDENGKKKSANLMKKISEASEKATKLITALDIDWTDDDMMEVEKAITVFDNFLSANMDLTLDLNVDIEDESDTNLDNEEWTIPPEYMS